MNWDGDTVLVLAVKNRDCEMVELLLRHGADVNSRGRDGTPPLIAAVQCGYLDILQILLAHGADVRCVSRDCKSPLRVACMNRNADVAEYLAGMEAVEVVSCDGWTPSLLPFAVEYGLEGVVGRLIERGCPLDGLVTDRESPLRVAMAMGMRRIVEMLLERGATPLVSVGGAR